jgi:hypothetical protein
VEGESGNYLEGRKCPFSKLCSHRYIQLSTQIKLIILLYSNALDLKMYSSMLQKGNIEEKF